ncbi:MAG: hypothetical protein ABEJ93_04250 [Candidatus Nanohalobium sp.]
MTSQYISGISDSYSTSFESVSELMNSDVVQNFPDYPDSERRILYRDIAEGWVANSKNEFEEIAKEGEETLMFPQEFEGTTVYLRPFMHNGDLCTEEERDRFTDEVDGIDSSKLYSEQGLIPPANNLNDNKWLAETLGVDENRLHLLDQRNTQVAIYDEEGEEWYNPITAGNENLSREEIENKPADFQKRLGAWAWMKTTPEPVQATIDNQLVFRESAILSSDRSIRMGKEIAEEAKETEEDEIHLYHGANHLVGIYSYLENPEVEDTVYEELDI